MSIFKGGFAPSVLLFLCLLCGVSAYAEVVVFPDPGLDAAVRETIGKPAGDITDADLIGLTILDASARGISNLSGLEHCTNLSSLYLFSNQITDISALSGLTNLTVLSLYTNQISDISALAGLANLTYLELNANQVHDIRALTGLTNLTYLDLTDNQISDISALSGLVNLTTLDMAVNQIGDISALAGLASLTFLFLGMNQIHDIGALTGLANLTDLDLSMNQISDISALAGLSNLTKLYVFDNQIGDISALSGLSSLIVLELGFNQIEDFTPLVGLTGLIDLGLNDNLVSDIGMLAGLINLKGLNLNENQISDLSPLAGLTNLTDLVLVSNQISDIAPLAGLTKLRDLNLGDNHISDLSALAGMTTNLLQLSVPYNQVSDLSPLTGLASLTWLNLLDNQIGDIMPLVMCSGLGPDDQVFLSYNPLSQQALCEQIPELQARWVFVAYTGECEATSGCGMFETLAAEGSEIAVTQGAALGLPTSYRDWDIERWSSVPYGDGMPDLWQLRLFADAYCNEHHRLHQMVVSAFESNMAALLADKPEVALSWTAAAVGLSTGMRSAVCAIYGLDPEHYQVYREPGKAIDEPFSAEGDCDGDGVSNVEEYEDVVASGGDIDDFAMQAAENDPFWEGNPDVPAVTAIGLVLLALGIGLGGVCAFPATGLR
jgi:internalin A